MNWFWLNIPLDAAFFLAVTGTLLWLAFRYPDTGPPAADIRLELAASAVDRVPDTRELVGAAR